MRRLFHEGMRRGWGQLRGGWLAGMALGLALGAMLFSGARGQMIPPPSQQGPMWPPSADHAGWPGQGDSRDPAARKQEEKMALARNNYRQEQLVKDTNRLLALATELKTEVDKTNKDILSVDVIKKADQIEKLAKSVKDKMKQ